MPHSDSENIGYLVADLSRLFRAEMERRITQAGLSVTPGEGRTLLHAARMGPVRQNVIAERLGVEAMTLSSYVDRLEARRLVTRSVDPTDRRAKLVALTPEAESVLAELQDIGAGIRKDLRSRMMPQEWDAMVRGIGAARSLLIEMKCASPARDGQT